MTDDLAAMFGWIIVAVPMAFVCLVIGCSLVDSPVNYPLGTEATTTDEYNAYCDEFTGHIVMQKQFGGVVVENEEGERKEFEAKQLRKVDKGTKVTTTDEYNAYHDEFTGHIVIQKKLFGAVVVENEDGERKQFYAEQLREVDKP